jgi:hypothetical protein
MNRFLSFVATVGGPTVVASGIATWLSTMLNNRTLERQRQKNASELEKLKGEIERTVYYTKTGFDSEFNALITIWKTLVDLKSTMTRAIAAMDVDPSNIALITPQDLDDCFKHLDETRTSFILAMEQNSPFYFEELYPVLVDVTTRVNDVLQRIRRVTYENRTELRRSQANGKVEFDAFNERVGKVAELMRKRLAQLGTIK